MWTQLSEIDPESHERFGYKAVRLLAPLKKGIPLPSSWVLSCRELASFRTKPEHAARAARELLQLAPEVKKFLLRSSSPWEDRSERSAAGLFRSIPSAANERGLAHALGVMADSTRDPRLAALLELPPEEVTLAVLAQEELELKIWATVECDLRAERAQRMRLEGSVHSARGPVPFDLELSFAAGTPHDKEYLSQCDARVQPYRVSLEALATLARRAIEGEEGIWLLELGTTSRGAVLLQRRPVQQSSPLGAHGRGRGTTPREDPPFCDFPLFPGDEEMHWGHDAAHTPGPLCPLLAGIFVDWIRAKGKKHPTRVIHGRWYELAQEEGEQPEYSLRTLESLREALRAWSDERIPRLEHGLKELSARYAPLPSLSSWPAFVRSWLSWQDRYFDGSASALRGLAAAVADDLQRSHQALPPLPPTVAARREREMSRLATRLGAMEEEEKERALEDFLARHGHVAPGAWDGHAVPWQEDATPLLAELERRADSNSPAPPPTPRESPGAVASPADKSAGQLAAHAFAALEDDDDLLARAYALFRGCALDLQAWLVPEAESAEILGVLPDELEELLDCAPGDRTERFARARARGKALVARWEAEFARENPLHEHRIEPGSILRGKALAAGSASGALCILPSAQSAGGPPPGAVLVVPLVLPADAIVFSRCAALICESGAVLGHAAVLAREKKIPALVLTRACSSLARAARVRVDGSRGEVEILSMREEGTSQ